MPPGTLVALLLRTVATAAREAVARPVAGTILTVADDAATAAERRRRITARDALAVAVAAQAGAPTRPWPGPLTSSTCSLPAGVVDAGGQAFVLLVDVLVEVLGGAPAEPLWPPAPSGDGSRPRRPGGQPSSTR